MCVDLYHSFFPSTSRWSSGPKRYLHTFLLFSSIFVKKNSFVLLHLVHALLGFISLDCGLSPNQPPYNDPLTGLTYSTDDGSVQSGKTGKIQKEFEEIFNKPSLKLRYFPDGVRNCYSVNVTEGTSYLIKAVFVYGNYDGLDIYPSFDLYLGPNLWSTVDMKGRTNGTIEEIIHRTISKSLQVCLVKTGTSNPFINTLELRPLKNDTYNTQSGSLKYFFRYYFSTSDRTIRYQSRPFDLPSSVFSFRFNFSSFRICPN